MFDTHVTVIGTAVTAPEWRRTSQSQTLVANFKVASTARRLDRESGRWVDGNSLRLRVNCWRRLAEGVVTSVMVGDPVIVSGRLHTRDWTDDAGSHRTHYELEAVAVGHDLSRGRGRFLRNRPVVTNSATADPTADSTAADPLVDATAELRVPGAQTGSASVAPANQQVDQPVDEEVELPALPDLLPVSGADVDLLDAPIADPGRGDAGSGQTDESPSAESTPGPAEAIDGASQIDSAGRSAEPAPSGSRARRDRGRVSV
ncbi:single-stranded DNA-binding protein [Salinispora sp. H7-4]|uniref:single-stranded DNA-binding protein n=1 Tax=Salinispora sp. H7-4 TaxID=2748321 RepID=UPI0015D442A8|nr:single-stranded DNA-binding protein [Salinispora sp. H7-4]NYT92726.1 single-stranded DNA-binding protein [Salinispora sp. H7-4]